MRSKSIPDDEQAIRDAHWQVAGTDVLLDIGCHEGAYTLPALAVGAKVTAIDCDQAGLDRLTANAKGMAGLTTVRAYITAGSRYPKLLLDQIRAGKSAVCAPKGKPVTVDDLALTLDGLTGVKIDVEGGELLALQGMSATIATHRPQLLIEDHTRVYPWVAKNDIRGQIVALLEAMAYEVRVIPHEPPEPNQARDFLVCLPH